MQGGDPSAADDAMTDEPTFVDLYALTKINPDSVVERFGSSINSSFFDASNILGGLKIKKLIDFTTLFGNQNAITVTDEGKQLLEEANKRTGDPFDHLDFTVLEQLLKGGKSPAELSAAMNLTQRDLAMHLYKLQTQGYLSSEFRNGNLNLTLTEKGFMQAKQGMPVAQQQQAAQESTAAGVIPPLKPPEQTEQPQKAQQGGQASLEQPKRKSSKGLKIAIAVIIIVVILALAWKFNVISMLPGL